MFRKPQFLVFSLLVLLFSLLPNIAKASLVYIPTSFDSTRAKLLVVIHGCLQSAESMALGTGWNQVADQENWVVLYPQVPEDSNFAGCWNWFLPENQKADSGQLFEVFDEIQTTKLRLGMQNSKVFLTGISSGGATVAGLMACYPDQFAAGAVHSGPSYGLAQNPLEAGAVLKQGPPAIRAQAPCQPQSFMGSVMVIQGTADQVVSPAHARQIIEDFLPGSTETSKLKKQSGGLDFLVTDFSRPGHANKGRLVEVNGLGHAWSGYSQNLRFSATLGPKGPIPTQVPYFSDTGPSATDLMRQFFKEN